jgi:hypothetical protein
VFVINSLLKVKDSFNKMALGFPNSSGLSEFDFAQQIAKE